MTYANGTFERTVSEWLHADAEHRVPDHLDAVLRLTSVQRQRPAWSSLERWLPMDTTFAGRMAPVMRPAWLLTVLLLVLALAAAILIVGTRVQRLPEPFGVAGNGAILYSAAGDIFIADSDGGRSRPLVGGPEIDVAPLPSNDGTRFIFFRELEANAYQMFEAKVDGRDVRPLTKEALRYPTWADWSPDGREIAVLHNLAGTITVSIIATDGSLGIRKLELGGLEPTNPTWRPPDGHEIVFRGVEGGNASVYAIGADGNGLHPIASVLKDDENYGGVRLSPDGTKVTFWHNKVADTPEGRKSEVHVLEIGTGRDRLIGYDPASRHELMPKFSPDGKSVLFVRFPKDGDARLVIAAADGSDDQGRSIGPSQNWGDGNPVFEFSPDGRKIVLTFGADFRRMQVIDIATGSIVDGEFADFPTWQRVAP